MALFEPYRDRRTDRDPAPALTDFRIRPAQLGDVAELGQIEAAREEGEAAEYASKLERALASWSATGQGLILVAQHGDRLAAVAKVRHFTPAHDAPANIAPRGWYLSGVIVVPEYRRQGIARSLTHARLDWIRERDCWAFYFANVRNRVSIELHHEFGFVEFTRDFIYPGATFEGGIGVLFRVELTGGQLHGAPTTHQSAAM